jgi:hypothetical protein
MKLLSLLLLAAPLYAGEIVPSQIPADAKWVFHADVDALRGSETGKAVFSRIEEKHGAQLLAMQRMFAIQPLTDIHGITLYAGGKPENGVALIDAKFDRAHLEDIGKGASEYVLSSYAAYTVHSWVDNGIREYAAFVSDSLLVFSRGEPQLHAALDVLKANAPAAADPFFATDGSKPLLAASVKLTEIELPGDAAKLVRMAKTLRLTANEAAGRFTVKLAAETKDAADAQHLQKMLDGVIAFAEVNNPQLEGLNLDSGVTLQTNPAGLAVTAGLPVAEWLSLLEKLADKQH